VERFEASSWRIGTASYTGSLDGELPGWDFSSNLAVGVRLQADLAGARSDCGLPADSALAALIHWRSSRTNLRGGSPKVELVEGINELHLDLDGGELGGRLELEVRVVLDEGQGDEPLAPTQPGSILWSERGSVDLEGQAERFPVELRDFRAAGLRGAGGAWVLHWDSTDPEWSASAAVRLWLNSRHPIVERLIEETPDPIALSVLKHDVTRQLIDVALDNEQLVGQEWGAGTLGAALVERVGAVFPGLSLDDCRALRRDRRDDFESALQAGTGLLGDER